MAEPYLTLARPYMVGWLLPGAIANQLEALSGPYHHGLRHQVATLHLVTKLSHAINAVLTGK